MKSAIIVLSVVAFGCAVGAMALLLAKNGAENRAAAVAANRDEVSRQLAEARKDLEEALRDVSSLRSDLEARKKTLAQVTAERDAAAGDLVTTRAEIGSLKDDIKRDASNRVLIRSMGDGAVSKRGKSGKEKAAPQRDEAEADPDAKAILEGTACNAVASALMMYAEDLEDPKALEPKYLRWLTNEGGWDIDDVRDLGKAVRVVREELNRWSALEQAGARQDITEERWKTLRPDHDALDRVKQLFREVKTREALSAFRAWRPRKD